MPYIGKTPLTGAYQLCDTITTSATATYNLLVGGSAVIPGSANNCIVSLNGVVQAPVGAFTVSGSQITFASALTSSDVIDFILILGNVFDIGTPTNGSVNTSKLATDLTVTHALGSAGSPSITFTGDTNTGIFSPTADTIAFTEGGTEAMRINSSGNVGIGTGAIRAHLDINDGTSNTTGDALYQVAITSADRALGSITGQLTIQSNDAMAVNKGGSIAFGGRFLDASTIGANWCTISGRKENGTTNSLNGFLAFETRAGVGSGAMTERMRIASDGVIAVGKTTNDLATVGSYFQQDGFIAATRSANMCFAVNRLVDDGDLVKFYQGTVEEGSISVSGNTVAYNGFTGSHWSRFIDESKPDVLRGTVLESLDQMIDWYNAEFETSYTEKDKDGNDVVKTSTQKKPYALKANDKEGDVITYSWKKKDEEGNDIIEQVQATIVKQVDVKHVMSKISDTVEAKNVYGVFSAWDNDDLINNDFYVASVGSYVVRIKAGQTVSKGDLLQSNGDGTAKVQADDIIRASTFAKVLSNTVIQTYEDGSFIVPCSLMC
jgi:hypothetical protein